MSIDNLCKGLRQMVGGGLVALSFACNTDNMIASPATLDISSLQEGVSIFYQDSSEATPCTLTAKARNPNTKEAIDLVFPNLKIGLNPVK